eukprot:GFUD01123310.1.p1 GENE.GFUD01123310.1~~GFUD01123310.1.p1  ORF type:complete len:191 (+),score=40.48 GFUD01123310.1:56-628(+)
MIMITTSMFRSARLVTRASVSVLQAVTSTPSSSIIVSCPTLLRNISPDSFSTSRGFKTSSVLGYDEDLFSASVLDGQKKYFIDLKQGQVKYVKISEVSNGKRATMMVDLEDLSSFSSKLMAAESGEEVGTLSAQRGRKSFDFKKTTTASGEQVVVTEKSAKEYRVYMSCEVIQELIKHLVNISDTYPTKQ